MVPRGRGTALPSAQHHLAVLYFKGLGVPVDCAEALAWEPLAADQRYPDAETGLAYVYETGIGVSLDYVAAFAWYSRASAHDERAPSERRKSLSRRMTHRQLDEASALFSELLRTERLIPPNNSVVEVPCSQVLKRRSSGFGTGRGRITSNPSVIG